MQAGENNGVNVSFSTNSPRGDYIEPPQMQLNQYELGMPSSQEFGSSEKMLGAAS